MKTLKTYKVSKSTTVLYSAIVLAESEEAAEKILENLELDSCFQEETCAENCAVYETSLEVWEGTPTFIQYGEGYKELTLDNKQLTLDKD